MRRRRMMTREGARTVAALGLLFGVFGGCKGEEAPAAGPAPAAVAPSEPAEAPDGAIPPSAAAPEAGEAVPPDEIAALAVTVAEIDCTALELDDPAAHDKAVEAILLRAGMTYEEYNDKVMKVIGDPTFKAVRERSVEMCKARVAAESAGDGAASEGALRENLKALAVASECMRKSGATSEEQAQAMLALYGAHQVDLQTYTREMAKLANNRPFQEEVAAATAKCPERAVAAVEEGAPDAGGEEPKVAGEAGAPPGEGGAAPEEEPDAAAPTEAPAAPTITGVYLGSVNPGGSMRVAISTRTVGVATAMIDGLNFRLNGRVMRDNVVHLAASAGDHWVQMRGKVDPVKRTYVGTWNGVLNGKRKSGTFSLKR